MDLKTTKASPVLADPSSSPISKSRLGMHSSLMPYSQSGTSFSSTILTIPRKKPAKLDNVRSNGWLDAMKSSSPPRKKILIDPFAGVSSDDGECAYQSWLVCCYPFSIPIYLLFCRIKKLIILLFSILISLYFSYFQLKFPSAISSFEKIIEYARNKKIVMFLDYDGTLSPIVDDPDRAFMSADVSGKLFSLDHINIFTSCVWIMKSIFFFSRCVVLLRALQSIFQQQS